MKKLKILLLLLVLIGAGWAGTTYFIGVKVQNRYEGMLEQYQNLGPFSLTGKSYQRGFLNSEAETVVKATVPGVEDQDVAEETVTLVFKHTLRHGPLAFGQGNSTPGLALIETRLVSVSPGEEDFARLLAKVPELGEPFAIFKVALNGSTNSRIQVPGFEEQIDKGHFSWGGLRFESDFAPGDRTMVGTFDMPKMEFHAADGDFVWNGFSGQFDLAEILPLLYVGTSKVNFGNMEMSLPDEASGQRKNVQMKGFEVFSDSSSDGKLVRYAQTMQFAGIAVDGKIYGPAVCEIEVSNLDCQTLAGFQGQVHEVYWGANHFNPDEVAAQVIPLYGQLLEKLVEGNPQLNIRRLHFATPMGDIDGRALVKFSGKQGLTLDNPAALLQHLEADAEVSVAQSLINAVMADSMKKSLQAASEQGRIPQYSDEEIAMLAEQQLNGQLEALVAQSYIVREGGDVKASATFNRGELVLNGQPLPLFQGN